MTSVPESLEDALSVKWLSKALGERWPGIEIASVVTDETVRGVGTKALVTLSYVGVAPPDAPTKICIKAGYEPHNQHILESGTYLKEARFYREVASEVPVNVPEIFYSNYNPETKQGVILMENLNLKGIVFGDALRGYSIDEAIHFANALAALHARFWGDRIKQVHPWLIGRAAVAGAGANSIYTQRMSENLQDARAANLPDFVRDADRLTKACLALAKLADEAPACLIHGDTHARNLYMTAEGEPGFFDWQTVQASLWALDISYYLGAALSHEDRRSSMEGIFSHYLERLSAHDVKVPAWDEAWITFRQAMVYGFYFWVITRPVVQPVEVINVYTDRLGMAVAELDSYGALGA